MGIRIAAVLFLPFRHFRLLVLLPLYLFTSLPHSSRGWKRLLRGFRVVVRRETLLHSFFLFPFISIFPSPSSFLLFFSFSSFFLSCGHSLHIT